MALAALIDFLSLFKMKHQFYSNNSQTNADIYLKELNRRRNDIILFATIHLNISNAKLHKNTMRDSLSYLKKLFFNIGHNFTSKPEIFIRASIWGKLHFHILLLGKNIFDVNGKLKIRKNNFFSMSLNDDLMFERYCMSMHKIHFKSNFCPSSTIQVVRFKADRFKEGNDAISYSIYQKTKPKSFKKMDLSNWFCDENNYLICHTNIWQKQKQNKNRVYNLF